MCGNTFLYPNAYVDLSKCNKTCNGNSSQYCGSNGNGTFFSVYNTAMVIIENIDTKIFRRFRAPDYTHA